MEKIDQELHKRIYEKMSEVHPNDIFSPRIIVLEKFENNFKKIEGNILDIGCGSGYAGIWLAKSNNVKVVSLDGSETAIKELVPRNINFHNVEEKVFPELGSFDDIKYENYFDFVVSFGALHHSKCLFSTMSSISKSLKPDGFLIAQEPAMPDITKNSEYLDKYNTVEDHHGLKIRNGDRDDHFFRQSEYIVSAAYSGLDLILNEDFLNKRGFTNMIFDFIRPFANYFKNYIKLLFKLNANTSKEEDPMAKHVKNVRPKVFIFQKNQLEYIPHLWKKLK